MQALILLAAAAQSGPSTAATQPAGFGWFGALAGSCWQGNHPGGRMRDRQCYSTQFGRFMRGTIALGPPGADTPVHRGDSIFAWDGERQRLIFYFWGSDGRHGVSEGLYDGDLLVFPQAPESAGQAPGRRTVWRRLDADHFRVSVQTREGSDWAERLAVTYARSGAAD
jgi:hypothetical protein